jgi:hypothetical protein
MPAGLWIQTTSWRFCFLFSLLPGEGVYTGRAYTAHTDTCNLLFIHVLKKTPTYDIKNKTHSVLSVYIVYNFF